MLEYYDMHNDVLAFTAGRDCVLPCAAVQAHQVHGVEVARIDSPDTPKEQLEGYDALVTGVPGVCIGARTADCIPILLYDPVHSAAAAIHSGWKGTVLKVSGNAIRRMSAEYGTSPADLLALIGPGICPDCFQVGEEVVEKFRDASFHMDRIWSCRGPRVEGSMEGGHHIDLFQACRQTLLECGMKAENISMHCACTYENTDRYYSARREGSLCGRNITAIMIK